MPDNQTVPSLAAVIRDHDTLRAVVRVGLTPVVWAAGWMVAAPVAPTVTLAAGILLLGAGLSWRKRQRRKH